MRIALAAIVLAMLIEVLMPHLRSQSPEGAMGMVSNPFEHPVRMSGDCVPGKAER